MKVLTLGRLPQNEVGGLPMYTVNLTRALEGLGVRQLVVHPGPDVPREVLDLATRAPAPVLWPRAGRLRSFRQAFAAAREAERAVHDFGPDVIHLQYGGAMDLALLARVARLGVPVVVTAHCGRAWAHLAKRPELAMRVLNKATRVLAISADQCALFAGAGLAPEKLAQVGSLVEEDFFVAPAPAPGRARPRAVYLGRIAPEKGLDLVIDALAALDPAERFDYHATGPVSDAHAAELNARATAAGVAAHFQLMGPVSTPAERRAVLDGADLVIHPTRSDVKPLVVIEALARALPVLASDLPGTVELMAGTGASFRVDDVADLARAYRALAQGGFARSPAARAVAEAYHPTAAARETLAHLRAAVTSGAVPSGLRRAS